MKTVTLNKNVRIKRDQNYETIEAIRNSIAERIKAEYAKDAELLALQAENGNLCDSEKEFYGFLRDFFKGVTPETKLRVVVQVGKGSKELFEYIGNIQRTLAYSDTWFNFISLERDNGSKPFTIAFSCLQSVEVIE